MYDVGLNGAYPVDLYGRLPYTVVALQLRCCNGGERNEVIRVVESRTRREERLEARVSRATKALFQKAAKIEGRSVTDFVVHSAVEAAKRTVQRNEIMQLTQRDRIAFVEALLNAPAPSARLKKAAQRHAQIFAD